MTVSFLADARSLAPAVYLAAGTVVLLAVGVASLMLARRLLLRARPDRREAPADAIDAWAEAARRADVPPPDAPA